MPYKDKEDHREHQRRYMRVWRKKNRDKCRLKNRVYSRHRTQSGRAKAQRQQLKREIIEAYGGKCECCGEHRHEFLCIDHRNGGGNIHRRTKLKGKSHGQALYFWIKRNNYPEELRILCANCNQALGLFGYCPHVCRIS